MYYHKFAYGFSSNNHFKDFWSFSTPCAMNHMHSAGIVVTNFICIKLANIFMFHSLGSHCNFFWKKYFNAQSLYDRANIKEQDFAIEFALPPVAKCFIFAALAQILVTWPTAHISLTFPPYFFLLITRNKTFLQVMKKQKLKKEPSPSFSIPDPDIIPYCLQWQRLCHSWK